MTRVTGFSAGRARAVAGRRYVPPRRSQFVGCRAVNVVDRISSRRNVSFEQVIRRSGIKEGVAKGATVMMFERFTEKAIKVVMLAQEESRRLGHNFVGTEQILLGLIGESTGISAKVLKSMGVTLKEARTEVEKVIGRGSGFVAVEIPFTPRAKRVLELSLEEARQLGVFRALRVGERAKGVRRRACLALTRFACVQATATSGQSTFCWAFSVRVRALLRVFWSQWALSPPKFGTRYARG